MLELCTRQGPTGRLLRQLLNEKGLLTGRVQAVVNYGYNANPRNLPTLNANAGRVNKYEELVKMDEAKVTTIPFSKSALDLQAPILGRQYHHTQGRDILVYQVRPLLRGDALRDFYTELIDKKKEFRIWYFRDKFLACYEKIKTYPAQRRHHPNPAIWNWGNGYAYTFMQSADVAAALKTIGKGAIAALDLDYGAVDVLQGKDNHYYALEVNSAPGTQGEARQGITSLVEKIAKWTQDGFPER